MASTTNSKDIEIIMLSNAHGNEITADKAPSSAEMWSFLEQSNLRREETCSESVAHLKDECTYTPHSPVGAPTRRQFQDLPMPRDDMLNSFLEMPPPFFKSALSTSFSLSGWSANFMTNQERVPTSIDIIDHRLKKSQQTASNMVNEDDTPIPLVDSLLHVGRENGKGDLPTIEEVESFVDQSHFEDGVEHSRNVIIDRTFNRSYVYTTDMEGRTLPEILFLDVPTSSHAARICGQWVADKLAEDLEDAMTKTHKNGRKERKKDPAKIIQDRIYQSKYEVKNVFIPCPEKGTVKPINLQFYLRLVRPSTKLYKYLRHSFFCNHFCTEGILVVIPFMESGSDADKFWGSNSFPIQKDQNGNVSNHTLDVWCRKISERYDFVHGKSREDHIMDTSENWIPLVQSPTGNRESFPVIETPKKDKNGPRVTRGARKRAKSPAVAKNTAQKQAKTAKASTIAMRSAKQQQAKTVSVLEMSMGGDKQDDSVKRRKGSKCPKTVAVSKRMKSSPLRGRKKGESKRKAKIVKKVVTKKPSIKIRLDKLKEFFQQGKKAKLLAEKIS